MAGVARSAFAVGRVRFKPGIDFLSTLPSTFCKKIGRELHKHNNVVTTLLCEQTVTLVQYIVPNEVVLCPLV